MAKYLGQTGLIYLWQKIKNYVSNGLSGKQDVIDGSRKLSADLLQDGTTNKVYTTTEQTKLAGIAEGAEVNQNAFSKVKVGSTTVEADGKTDTLELASSGDVTLTADTANDKVTIGVTVPKKLSDLTNDGNYYQLPSDGIPKTDLSSGVQASLDKADSALQTETDPIYSASPAAKHVSGGSDDVTVSANEEVTIKTAGASGNTIHLFPAGAGGIDITTSPGKELTYNGKEVATTDTAVLKTQIGAANGVASLDESGKVPSEQLPSYVDDVIEVWADENETALSQNWFKYRNRQYMYTVTPETGKIYVLMEDSGDYAANSQFRWGGSQYVKLNDGGVSEMTTAEMDTATQNWS